MSLTFRERQAVIKELAEQYQRASKSEKVKLLDQLQSLTGFNRSYPSELNLN